MTVRPEPNVDALVETVREALRATPCLKPMLGLYGAETTCSRPKGHIGTHDPIWNYEEWGIAALSALAALARAAAEANHAQRHPFSTGLVAMEGRDRLARRIEELEQALREILNELGVPDENYAAPISNAVGTARAVLAVSTGPEEATE